MQRDAPLGRRRDVPWGAAVVPSLLPLVLDQPSRELGGERGVLAAPVGEARLVLRALAAGLLFGGLRRERVAGAPGEAPGVWGDVQQQEGMELHGTFLLFGGDADKKRAKKTLTSQSSTKK